MESFTGQVLNNQDVRIVDTLDPLGFKDINTADASTTVTIRDVDGLALSSIFSDNSGTVQTNPYNTNSTGEFKFYAENGRYNIVINEGLGTESQIDDISLYDIINDLSQAYEFPTVALFKASLIEFPDGKTIRLLDRGADFTKISGIDTGNDLNIVASTSVSQSIVLSTTMTEVTTRQFGLLDDGSAETASFQALLNAGYSKVIYHNTGIDDYVILPSSVELAAQEPAWRSSTGVISGSKILAVGNAAGSVWTNITGGADKSDFKPMLVLGGSGAKITGFGAVVCTPTFVFDCGVFMPCLKQCQVDINTWGPFDESGVYQDATWSDRNTVLSALHPEIVSDTGMNDNTFGKAAKCQWEGRFGLKIKGTDDDPVNWTAETWPYAWGGVNDNDFNGVKFQTSDDISEASRLVTGGTVFADAQLFSNVGRWNNFNDCNMRSVAVDQMNLNRIGVKFFGCNGETRNDWKTANGKSPIRITSNTLDVTRSADTIDADIIVDGINRGRDNYPQLEAEPKMLYDNPANGSQQSPAISCNYAGLQPTRIRSYISNGAILFVDGDDVEFARISKNGLDSPIDILRTPRGEATISSGVITVNSSYIRIDTEGGAATDDVATINGGDDGTRVVFRALSNSRDITFQDGVGNLALASDFVTLTSEDTLELIYDDTDNKWRELSRSTNG